MAPLPLLVGPLTYTVPPVIVRSPLESTPSPPASTRTLPPLIRSSTPLWAAKSPPRPPQPESVLPAVAFSPSSEAVMVTLPPEMRMTFASAPS